MSEPVSPVFWWEMINGNIIRIIVHGRRAASMRYNPDREVRWRLVPTQWKFGVMQTQYDQDYLHDTPEDALVSAAKLTDYYYREGYMLREPAGVGVSEDCGPHTLQVEVSDTSPNWAEEFSAEWHRKW